MTHNKTQDTTQETMLPKQLTIPPSRQTASIEKQWFTNCACWTSCTNVSWKTVAKSKGSASIPVND